MNNGGDVLARGARKANFPAAGGKVTQEKWDAIWAPEAPEVVPEPEKKKNTKE